eukprot:645435-Prorocentrum_minimum.AAC.1
MLLGRPAATPDHAAARLAVRSGDGGGGGGGVGGGGRPPPGGGGVRQQGRGQVHAGAAAGQLAPHPGQVRLL